MRKVNSIKVAGYTLYVNPNTATAKVGSKGQAMPLGWVLGTISKGEARKLRKSLRADGHASLAGTVAQRRNGVYCA